MSEVLNTPSKKIARKKVYNLLEGILGRDLTITEHEQVREAVNNYIAAELGYMERKDKKREHLLICKECAAKKTVFGNKEIKNAYRGKRRGFIAE